MDHAGAFQAAAKALSPTLSCPGYQPLDVQAFANNHYAGHGPATIRELIQRVGGS